MKLVTSRLLWLHLRSRRAPLALLLLIATGVLLRLAQPWTTGTGESATLLPLVLAVGAASVIATSTTSPFGESERATYPPSWLRLIQVTALLLAGTVFLGLARLGHDPCAAIRNLAGFAGLALLTATVINAPMAWIAPLSYAIYCGGPVDIHSPDLWSWPALPSSNHAATVIALTLLGAGVLGISHAGARDHHSDPG